MKCYTFIFQFFGSWLLSGKWKKILQWRPLEDCFKEDWDLIPYPRNFGSRLVYDIFVVDETCRQKKKKKKKRNKNVESSVNVIITWIIANASWNCILSGDTFCFQYFRMELLNIDKVSELSLTLWNTQKFHKRHAIFFETVLGWTCLNTFLLQILEISPFNVH